MTHSYVSFARDAPCSNEKGHQRHLVDERCGFGQSGTRRGAEVQLCNVVARNQVNAKDKFRRDVEKDLTGEDGEHRNLSIFKLYKNAGNGSGNRNRSTDAEFDSITQVLSGNDLRGSLTYSLASFA